MSPSGLISLPPSCRENRCSCVLLGVLSSADLATLRRLTRDFLIFSQLSSLCLTRHTCCFDTPHLHSLASGLLFPTRAPRHLRLNFCARRVAVQKKSAANLHLARSLFTQPRRYSWLFYNPTQSNNKRTRTLRCSPPCYWLAQPPTHLFPLAHRERGT